MHARTLSIVLLATIAFAAHGAPTVPAIFGDHMVLQRNAPVPLWGWAEPGEKVAVAFAVPHMGL